MSHRAHPLKNLPSLGSVQLGRFVLNPKSPLQGFHDPLPDRPTACDYNTCSQSDVERTETFSKCSKLGFDLSSLLSICRERQSKKLHTIRSPLATTHELRNSSGWFEEACGKPETREWIGQAVQDDSDIYLVVGYLVVQDADISTWKISDVEAKMTAQCPTVPLHTGATVAGLTPGVLGSRGTAHNVLRVFNAPGDRIYAVQYRKLKFKWFDHAKSSSFLERKSRWKFSMEWRGNDDGEEGEEILEASLEDDSDLVVVYEGLDEDDGDLEVTHEGLDEKIHEASPTITNNQQMPNKDNTSEDFAGKRVHVYPDVVVVLAIRSKGISEEERKDSIA